MTHSSELPESPDPALSHLFRLAEGIVEKITGRTPDWCQVARDARELAERAQERCENSAGGSDKAEQ